MPQIIIGRPPKRTDKSAESDKILIIIEPYSLEVYTDDDAEQKLADQKLAERGSHD